MLGRCIEIFSTRYHIVYLTVYLSVCFFVCLFVCNLPVEAQFKLFSRIHHIILVFYNASYVLKAQIHFCRYLLNRQMFLFYNKLYSNL